MNSISIVNPALAGMKKGLDGMNRAASEIASADQSSEAHTANLSTSMVNLRQAQIQVAVSAKVIQAIDESIGYLIDDFA